MPGPIQLKIGMQVAYHPGKDMGLHNKVQVVVCLFARARRARAHYQTYLGCQGALCFENEVRRSRRLLPDFARAKPGSLLVVFYF